jgi:hypothetical protein
VGTDWHKTADRKPKHIQHVLGYWKASKAFFVVIYFKSDKWFVTTGGYVPPPNAWTALEPPDL